jgi:hypothetical protein
MTMIKKMGEAMSKIKKDTSRSNKGLIVLIYKIDKVMRKNRESSRLCEESFRHQSELTTKQSPPYEIQNLDNKTLALTFDV